MTTEQVQLIYFRGEYAQRKSQERLLKLYRQGKLQRSRVGDGPFIYSLTGSKNGLPDHTIGVNWCRMWWETCGRREWETVHSWEYERDYKALRHDGFIALKNAATGAYRFAFVEFDRGTNSFNKVSLYNKLYEAGCEGRWWFPLTTRFPVIFVATGRVKHVKQKIQEENSAGLEWIVKSLDEIREEVFAKCYRSET